jgi:DNA invertase Pin-like site-specific DNA recombinase
MNVWVEQPTDGGSAVWGCNACERGAWCSDHTRARLEARLHARTHGTDRITTIGQHHGPRANTARDARIRRLRDTGHTVRAIATAVGISTTGVLKSLRRTKETA